MRRRAFLASIPGAPFALSAAGGVLANPQQKTSDGPKTGRLKQGVAIQGLLGGANRPLDQRCQDAVRLGIKGFDLIDDVKDWPTMKKYGLEVSLFRITAPAVPGAPPPAPGRGPTGPPGWHAIAMKEAMGAYLDGIHAGIDYAAANGVTNMLLQCGAKSDTLDSATGADNAVAFCNAVKKHAEDKKIIFQIELLNAKGQMAPRNSIFDHVGWGVDVVKRVNSPNFKVLYDIFHAQLGEGNIVQSIRDNIQYIGHIHTGGVPGRHEIDETQELNYHFIAQAIADLNFTGYISHEWNPTAGTDPIAGLTKAIQIMTV